MMAMMVIMVVAVMAIMLIDDNGEDVFRSDNIGGSDGDNSEDDNGGDAVGSDDENGDDGGSIDGDIGSDDNRVLQCDVIKKLNLCQDILKEQHPQEAYLPKTSIVGQIVTEILAQLCSDDSIQIILSLTWV